MRQPVDSSALAVRPRPFPWGIMPAVVWATWVTLMAGWSPRSPTRMVFARAWMPPSWDLPLGATEGGVDLLAALCHATARGLGLALIVTGSGFLIGLMLGTAAGLRGGWLPRLVARACDLVQAFPTFLIALAVLAAVPHPGRFHLGLVFAVTAWAPFARMALGQAQLLQGAAFVEAAWTLGASPTRVVARHILPNLLGPVLVQAGSSAAAVVLSEAALAFVGLGPRDGVSLGTLLEQGTLAMLRAPHVLFVTAVAVALTSGTLQAASASLRRP